MSSARGSGFLSLAQLPGSRVLKYLILGTVLLICTATYFIYPTYPSPPAVAQTNPYHAAEHPIDTLISRAQAAQTRLLHTQSHTLSTAVLRYQDHRGRRPPPGFDAWFKYAQDHDAVIVEDFFDRIYDDLNPFWALEPSELRRRSAPWAYDHVVSVRNHTAILKTDGKDPMGRMEPWLQLVEELAQWLPDVDMPMNIMDESRLLVPWEEIDQMVQQEAEERRIVPLPAVSTEYTGLPPTDAEPEDGPFDVRWLGDSNWDLLRETCSPDAPSRNVPPIDRYHDAIDMPTTHPSHSFSGYVQNWTLSKDACQHPHLRSLHGTFIEPVSIRTTRSLIPLFGGSKLGQNNDILVPPAMYLSTKEIYTGGGGQGPAWRKKKDGVVWRGVASGGRNKLETWTHFHRHRYVQMLNGSAVHNFETLTLPAAEWAFKLPSPDQYSLTASHNGTLGNWLSTVTDVAFTRLECFPYPPDTEDQRLCSYTNPYFEIRDSIPMQDQYVFKYLPDVDGNSYSGRFRAFLDNSNSVVLKATLYHEWHDSRLMPWVHFVPFDNTYIDVYGILDFFLAAEDHAANDKLAERIAREGRDWAGKVLRREDMALYVWRLILEFARLCDDERDVLGWVDDVNIER